MPWFGISEFIIALAIGWWCRSVPAYVGALALIATMSLRFLPVEFVPFATAIWATAGCVLILRGDYAIGWLYGLSGMFYLLLYSGLTDTRYAFTHWLSDIAFLAGLILVVWPKGIVIFRGAGRRGVPRLDYPEMAGRNKGYSQVSGREK